MLFPNICTNLLSPIFRPQPHVDLELPQVANDFVYVPAANVPVSEPPVKKFKEKTIESLNDGSYSDVSNSFKKRKTTIKRNVRQRLDDD